MVLNEILNPILSPILLLPPFWAVVIFSFIISFTISIVYKLMTDQNLMKQLKEEMKELQKEMKELRGHPEKLMVVQKKSMETNMKYMTKSFKPTLITFIPIIIIFGWMSAHLAYFPIMPSEEFSTSIDLINQIGNNVTLEVPEGIELLSDSTQKINSDTVIWKLKGKEGSYSLTYTINKKSYQKEVIISKRFGFYSPVEEVINDNQVSKINLSNKKLQPLREVGLGFIPWFGNFGWLGTYILFSILFSIIIRKSLKIA